MLRSTTCQCAQADTCDNLHYSGSVALRVGSDHQLRAHDANASEADPLIHSFGTIERIRKAALNKHGPEYMRLARIKQLGFARGH